MMSLFWQSKQAQSRQASDKGRLNDEESCPESWVELAPPSRGSLCSSFDAMAGEVERENNIISNSQNGSNAIISNKSINHSPKSLQQSPNVEFETNLEQIKYKLASDMLPPGRNTDWIWDWSSRPEAVPPKGLRFRPPHCSSALSTPPNSPAPSLLSPALSLRHSKIIQTAFFRVEVLLGLVVSNLITFVLGAALGFCICKRLYDKADQI